jgi:hypothetical protein
MTVLEIIIALTIHLLLPLIGLNYFIQVRKRIKNEEVQNAPIIELFIIFATYGGLLLVTLTTLFWKWSGMASLGSFYLILGAPIAMGIISYRHRKTRKDSKYHKWTYLLGILYFAIASATFLILYVVIEYLRINGL